MVGLKGFCSFLECINNVDQEGLKITRRLEARKSILSIPEIVCMAVSRGPSRAVSRLVLSTKSLTHGPISS